MDMLVLQEIFSLQYPLSAVTSSNASSMAFPCFSRTGSSVLFIQFLYAGLMFCQLSFPVYIVHTSDLFHPFNDGHLCIPESIFRTISVFIQKRIILCIKGIYCIQKSDKMVVDASTPVLLFWRNQRRISPKSFHGFWDTLILWAVYFPTAPFPF